MSVKVQSSADAAASRAICRQARAGNVVTLPLANIFSAKEQEAAWVTSMSVEFYPTMIGKQTRAKADALYPQATVRTSIQNLLGFPVQEGEKVKNAIDAEEFFEAVKKHVKLDYETTFILSENKQEMEVRINQYSYMIRIALLPTFDFTIRGMHTTHIMPGNAAQELRTMCKVLQGCLNAMHGILEIPPTHNYDYAVSTGALLAMQPAQQPRRVKVRNAPNAAKGKADAEVNPFDVVGGYAEVKATMEELASGLVNPQVYALFDTPAPRGLLLCGPPGTGKTSLVKAMAKIAKARIEIIRSNDISTMWYGESERKINELFERAAKNAPTIIVFDEIDAMAGQRDHIHEASQKVLSIILQKMDGMEELNGVLVVATTNRKDSLDQAILRPGRFDRIIDVPLPDVKARADIFRIHLKGKPLATNIDYQQLAKDSEGMSGADIMGVVSKVLEPRIRAELRRSVMDTQRDAGMTTPRPAPSPITLQELLSVLQARSRKTLPEAAKRSYA